MMARMDAGNMELPKDEPLDLSEVHGGKIEIEAINIANKDAFELEKFMNEPVSILVHESTDENTVMAIPLGVSGTIQWVVRGVEMTVKRKYVEVLARARTTVYKQSQAKFDITDSRPEPKTAMSYPFSVVKDNAKGASWLREIINQRA